MKRGKNKEKLDFIGQIKRNKIIIEKSQGKRTIGWETVASIASSITAILALVYTIYFNKEQLKASLEQQNLMNRQFEQNFELLNKQANTLTQINAENKTVTKPYFECRPQISLQDYKTLYLLIEYQNIGKKSAFNLEIFCDVRVGQYTRTFRLVNEEEIVAGAVHTIQPEAQIKTLAEKQKIELALRFNYYDKSTNTPNTQRFLYYGIVKERDIEWINNYSPRKV